MEEITAILSDDDSDTDPDYEDDNEISSSDSDDIESNPKLAKKNPRSDIHSDACDEQVVILPQFFEPERTASYKSNTALWRACL